MIGSVLTRSTIQKGHPTSALILQSPNTTKWILRPNSSGVLVAFPGAAGTVTDIKFDASGTEYSFHISNNGELQTKNGGDLSGTATLVSDFRIRGEDGQIYQLEVNSNGEIQLVSV